MIVLLLLILLLFDNQALQRKTITFFITQRLVSNNWVQSLKSKNVAPELMNVTMMLRERLSAVPSEPSSSSSTEVDRCPFSCPRRTL